MVPSEPLEVVRAYNEAYHARDLDGMLTLVDEACEFVTRHRIVMRGHDAVRAFMDRQTYGATMVPTDQRYYVRGQTVAVYGVIEWRHVESGELAGRDEGATLCLGCSTTRTAAIRTPRASNSWPSCSSRQASHRCDDEASRPRRSGNPMRPALRLPGTTAQPDARSTGVPLCHPRPRRWRHGRPGDCAFAAPPAAEELNPPPPEFLTCKPLGAGTICSGSFEEVKVSEPQPDLVCGSGADAFLIHDNAVLVARVTRWYNADGDLTRRVIQERGKSAFWSNPLTGKTVPYTQTDKITTVLAVPGDFDSATETTVGENVYTDPVTHQKVLRSTGRVVLGADGTLEFRAGQQPFLDAFVDGDLSVFDGVCAALA